MLVLCFCFVLEKIAILKRQLTYCISVLACLSICEVTKKKIFTLVTTWREVKRFRNNITATTISCLSSVVSCRVVLTCCFLSFLSGLVLSVLKLSYRVLSFVLPRLVSSFMYCLVLFAFCCVVLWLACVVLCSPVSPFLVFSCPELS